MPPVGRFMLGAFAVFIMSIFSDGVAYDANKQPRMFASMATIHGIGAFFFAWLAASGDIAAF